MSVINLTCKFSVPLGRFDYYDYVRALDLSVESFDDVILGKIAADVLLLSDAENDGWSVFDVCDADSQGMYELYEALFEKGQFQAELGVNEVTFHIVFLWRSVLHPKLQPYQQAILEVITTLFGHECVVVMWRDVFELSDKQLAEMGFSKIAGTRFVFRHAALRTDYSDQNPQGIEVDSDFESDDDDEKWVLGRWKKDDDMSADLQGEGE